MIAPLLEHPTVQAGELLVLAHPAASALALILIRLQRYRKIRRAVIQIFEHQPESAVSAASPNFINKQPAYWRFKTLDKGSVR